jgi:polar amino acid transport system substrate-binding protein
MVFNLRHQDLILGWISALWVVISLSPQQTVAATLTEIRQRGHLIVAVKDNLEPLAYRTTSGTLQGFEIAIVQQLAQAILGSKQALQLKPVSNVERLSAVTSGEVDIAIAQITVTENRMRLVSFSEPYYRSGTGLLTQLPQWQSLQSLSRHAIAVLQPSVTLPYLHSALPKAQLVGVQSYTTAQQLLDNAKVQAIVGDQIVLSNLARYHPSYRFYPTNLTVQPLAIALPKGIQYESLRAAINLNIRQWQHQGWLETQRQAWKLP